MYKNLIIIFLLNIIVSYSQNESQDLYVKINNINVEIKSGEFQNKNKSLDRLKFKLDKIQNDSLYGLFYRVYSNYYNNILEDEKSIHALNLSINHYKKANNILGIVLSSMNKGNKYVFRGENEIAFKVYYNTLKLAEKNNLIKEQAGLSKNLGVVLFNLNNIDDALKYYLNSLKLFQKLNNTSEISAVYVNIGNCYNKKTDLNNTLKYYNLAEKFALSVNDSVQLAKIYGNKGSVFLDLKKDTTSALIYMLNALKIKKLYNSDINDLIFQYTQIGTIYQKKKDYLKAKKYIDIAFQMASQNNNNFELNEIYSQYAQIFEGLKDYKNAYKYQSLYTELNEKIFNLESKENIENLNIKYQSVQKEKEILKKDIELKNSRYLTIGLIGLAVVLASLGFLINRHQKFKNKNQLQEFQLKEAISEIETQNKLNDQRLSISRDLHDNIGAQLTFIISSVENLKFGFPTMEEKIGNHLSRISDFTRHTILELRDTIWAMNNNKITFSDFNSRLRIFLDHAQLAKNDIQFDFNSDEVMSNFEFSSIEGINIYRVIQEAVNNAIKYANPSKVNVNFKMENSQKIIEIVDNGIGFDRNTLVCENGLQNMEKRIQEIGGNFHLISSKDQGTSIKIIL